ncbi:uncharacterized protein LOC117648003 isoform X2 [Thrips palmi]|uniref:Uncharacterized protein LOC117648003 isoform X2 n=1 Tax=Thrips palmi TaxID=161013 RepID=A0A6P8Z7C6_THRPL|nr:uncharacterized protein LOC117648003 isoform X2 [Thrips palmi]
MIRSLLLVVGLVAAAFADDYAFNQIYEMAERIEVCLKPVKDQSSFELPAGMCLMETRWSLVGGLAQDMVPADVASCLKERNVPNDTVATVEECLVDSMAVPLKPALEEADYSAEQRDEISSRIEVCLSSIPETQYATPASDCRNNALLQADDGYPKETLVDFIVPCLEGKKISAAVVAQAQTCIAASLAQPL